ncbi:MAG: 3-deoxy-8-phosphooctulonate synthase [Candidatus Omnitrophica bacterium]|nr:3-deoxy-8-phosphooctulonate synthase [Candidatus Omnitrophota bacterium]
MKTRIVKAGKVSFGGNLPFVLIAGPCVIESRAATIKMAGDLVKLTKRLGIPYVFKASYDKANRTSSDSFRGPGLADGLDVLREVKERFGVPVVSDVHEVGQVEAVASVLDIIQIPAFLCRQTDLVLEVARTRRVVNIKKGQFLAPWDVKSIVRKVESTGNRKLLLTERGVTFGYNNLVTDFKAFQIMRETGYPVVYDVTHSVQQPGGLGHATGGQSEFIQLLSRCGVAAGVDAIFMETHTNPKKALSDGPNMIAINRLEPLLEVLLKIDGTVKKVLG